jgi:membrane-bound serine protease (ClpP class)
VTGAATVVPTSGQPSLRGGRRPRGGRRTAVRRALVGAACVVGAGLLLAGSGVAKRGGVVSSIPLTGTIDPATERWVGAALDDARERGVEVVIMRLDTPGGLDSSMRGIVRSVLAAPMPVVVYVSPNGARAASAGLFVTQAGDVAAMAPQTNIGSATPVSVGGGDQDEVLGRKIRNDAAAYVRALAEGHGRNGDLAEHMVRDAVNVTASEARGAGLVDSVAPTEQTLLERLDGFEIRGPKARILDTDGLRIERRDTPLQYQALQLLVNPTIAYLLLLGGAVGVVLELLAPGLIGPGALGAVSLVLGLYGTAQLPVTAAGVILLVLALGLLVAEIHAGSGGILGMAGVAALIAGGLLLFDTDSDAVAISVPAVVGCGALLGGLTLFTASRALAARHARPAVGDDQLVGAIGTVRVALEPVGQVYVDGALWRARSVDPDASLARGQRVEIARADGLTLYVRPTVRDPEPFEERSLT